MWAFSGTLYKHKQLAIFYNFTISAQMCSTNIDSGTTLNLPDRILNVTKLLA